MKANTNKKSAKGAAEVTTNVNVRTRNTAEVVAVCIRAYQTAANIKANKARICEKYGLDQRGYMSVIRDAKDKIQSTIKDSAKAVKSNVLGYENILRVAYTELAASNEYALLASYAADNGKMDVTAFVQQWYNYIDREGNILCKRDYTDGKNVYTYLVAKETFTGAFALSVISNCLDNFARLAIHKGAKVKEYAWTNRYDANTLSAAYRGLDKEGRLVKGEKFVAKGVRVDDLQPLADYNKK